MSNETGADAGGTHKAAVAAAEKAADRLVIAGLTLSATGVGTSIIGELLPLILAAAPLVLATLIRVREPNPAGRQLATGLLASSTAYVIGAISAKTFLSGWIQAGVSASALIGSLVIEREYKKRRAAILKRRAQASRKNGNTGSRDD